MATDVNPLDNELRIFEARAEQTEAKLRAAEDRLEQERRAHLITEERARVAESALREIGLLVDRSVGKAITASIKALFVKPKTNAAAAVEAAAEAEDRALNG